MHNGGLVSKNLKYIFKAALFVFWLFDVNGIKKIDLPVKNSKFFLHISKIKIKRTQHASNDRKSN